MGGGEGSVSCGTTLEKLHKLARERAARRKEREWADKSAREIYNDEEDVGVEERLAHKGRSGGTGKRKTKEQTVLPRKRRNSEADMAISILSVS